MAMLNETRRLACFVVSLVAMWSASTTPAPAQQPYVADPDPDKPTLHVQPPGIPPALRNPGTKAPASVINGITYIDVFLNAGYDLANDDRGNEPAITANPLDPNQIVLTSFSGSDWPTGGNATFFYSSNGGTSWTYIAAVPPPPGTTTNYYCPCDQTMDWGRDGQIYGTFLHFNTGGTVSTVFSAQATDPTDPGSWVYRAPGGVAQSTNLPAYIYPDQPWLWSGPLPGDNSQTNVCVAYDNFDSGYANSQIRGADSPGANPLDFSRDAPSNSDGQQYNDGMNPGNRIAVGPDGKIFNVFQRLEAGLGGGVKQLTYLINVSADGGQTWSVANSDHLSGAKIVAASQLSFQGNGSKIGGVNALLGGVDAIAADRGGNAWVVYGARATMTSHDQLFLVKVTYSAGSLTVGTPVTLSSSTLDSYLPSVAVLPNGEVGVLFITLSGSTFQWRFQQYTNGTTLNKTTGFPSFTSPFTSSGASNQRIFGDYVQVRAAGCKYYGTYPAKGSGANSATSIEPYFMSAPSQAPCTPPTLTSLVPSALCAGGPDATVALHGTGYSNGATGRVQGSLRSTTFDAATQVTMAVQAADIAAPGAKDVDLLGAAPAGGLTSSLPLTIELPPASPGNTLRVDKSANVDLSWSSTAAATRYAVHRCDATSGPCSPAPIIASPPTNAFSDAVLADGFNYWYTVDAVNSCGAVP
jgi:hypothetical protein